MNTVESDVIGIVLAAGEGRRLGRTKALLELQGISFLESIVARMRDAGCKSVTVVGGADADSVERETLRLGARFVLNRTWEAGQFSSLKTGLAAAESDVPGVLVALVDHPLVLEDTYRELLDSFQRLRDRIVIPTYDARRGHPVLLPRAVVLQILSSPDTTTLRDIIQKNSGSVVEVPVSDLGILRDIDTTSDLENARRGKSN